MQRFDGVLLNGWRELCRHAEIGAAAAKIVSLIEKPLSVRTLLVRQFHLERHAIETVALAGVGGENRSPLAVADCPPGAFDQLVAWCRRGEIVAGEAGQLNSMLPHLVPAELNGEVWAIGLTGARHVLGVLILVGTKSRRDREARRPLVAALQEPFTIALENDHRWRELVALREKAETENRSLLSKLGKTDTSESIVGAASGLREVMQRVELVAPADVPVLILGETGSGKEVVARAIHRQSNRSAGPFVRVNCGAIPPELVDSELFGHEKGSFTGAAGVRKGWFERADGGTLFLDECGDLPPAVQVRLLRVLQDGTFERVGGELSLHVDVRVVAATHRDLKAMVAQGRFREDLWYRLAVFPIDLPPLRDRPEDIPAMAAHFATRAAARFGLRTCLPADSDVGLLVGYRWPGNVRELAAVIERAALLGDGQFLDIKSALGQPAPEKQDDSRPSTVGAAARGREPSLATLDEAMRSHIELALSATRGRIEGQHGAAAILGINPFTLRARMRKLGIDWGRFREPSD